MSNYIYEHDALETLADADGHHCVYFSRNLDFVKFASCVTNVVLIGVDSWTDSLLVDTQHFQHREDLSCHKFLLELLRYMMTIEVGKFTYIELFAVVKPDVNSSGVYIRYNLQYIKTRNDRLLALVKDSLNIPSQRSGLPVVLVRKNLKAMERLLMSDQE
jgi:hypothetical protein